MPGRSASRASSFVLATVVVMAIGTADGRPARRRGVRAVGAVATVAVTLVSVTLVAGCTSSSPSAQKRTSLSASSTSATSTPSLTPSITTSTTTATTASTSPKPTSSTSLGGDCAAVLPVVAVDRAVGKTVPGQTAFVINVPDYSIGQVERVNCQYGLVTPKGKTVASAPLVEASVSLYDTSAHAATRVAATQETWREHQAIPHAVTVAGHRGVVLVGYGPPLLVLGVGARTLAISAATTLVPAARTDAVLVALAASALRGAGG